MWIDYITFYIYTQIHIFKSWMHSLVNMANTNDMPTMHQPLRIQQWNIQPCPYCAKSNNEDEEIKHSFDRVQCAVKGGE